MEVVAAYPNPWALPDASPLARHATRPPQFRQRGFYEQFDSKTIFYDCVSVKEIGAIVLQGPPFLNLLPQLSDLRVCTGRDGESLSYAVREGDRHAQIWVNAGWTIETLRFHCHLADAELRVSADGKEFFRGMRVLLTKNKNNQLNWICDWVRFHRDLHGANAVLLYDNASNAYDMSELLSRLASLSAIECVVVVSWPFKFGPQGFKGYWGSDFCEYGALENARWRFLQLARSVVSCDIDELVVTDGRSVFELAESSGARYVTFLGKWIVGVENEPRGSSYTDFRYALRPTADSCPAKWAVAPAMCPRTAQWMTHLINGMACQRLQARTACYGHFREITTHWKYDRSRRDGFDPARHFVDEKLRAAFEKVAWNR